MSTRSFPNLLFVTAIILAVASCKKEAIVQPAWFSNHSRFYYDLITDTSIVPNYRLLKVVPGLSTDELFFYETPTDTSIISWPVIFGIFDNGFLKSKPDGLYRSASNYCAVGPLNSTFDYLFIPAKAETAAHIPLYGCEHKDAGYNEMLIADTLITVPAGTFHTFCVLHPTGDRSYWNSAFGIIMFEEWNHDRAFPFVKLRTLGLRKME